MNKKGKFDVHGAKTKEAVQGRIQYLKVLAPRANRDSLWKIANAVCISKITYGIELYGLNLTNAFQTTFNQILRIASGALLSSPIGSLAVEAGVLPLNLRLAETFIRRYCRLAEKSDTEYQQLSFEANKILQDATGYDLPNIAKRLRIGNQPWYRPRIKIDWSVKTAFKKGDNVVKAKTLVRECQERRYGQHLQLYTDGSRTCNNVGLGVVGHELKVEGSLQTQCSVFSAEAAALAIAVQHASTTPTVIFTDSASCVAALAKGDSKHPFIQRIENSALQKSITVCWIPGHSGIAGNEEADRAADRGRTAPLLFMDVPADDVIRWVSRLISTCFQQFWEGHRPTFLQGIKPTVEKWIDRQDRQEQRVLTRCRIGHTKLTKAYLYDRNASSTCDACSTELTIAHIVVNCIKYDDIRNQLNISRNIDVAFSNRNTEEVKLIKFLKKSRLFSKM